MQSSNPGSDRAALGSTQLLAQLLPGLKRAGREADHLSLSSAKVKNE